MAKDTNKNNKEKKHFFKDFKAELKKVIWPTPKQLVNNTTAVITMVLITALIVFMLDFCFESINKYGINKLKEAVASTQNEVTEENTVNDSNTENTEESNNTVSEDATDTDDEENTNNPDEEVNE